MNKIASQTCRLVQLRRILVVLHVTSSCLTVWHVGLLWRRTTPPPRPRLHPDLAHPWHWMVTTERVNQAHELPGPGGTNVPGKVRGEKWGKRKNGGMGGSGEEWRERGEGGDGGNRGE